MKYVFFYLLFINVFGSFVTAYDKYAAIKKFRRVSEKTLFILSTIGASPLIYVTMRLIRHKTLHKRFMIGIPLIILVQIVLVIVVLKYS